MSSERIDLETMCIIGLGYVGLTLAVAMANAGYRVHGVEISERIRESISSGKAHFSEIGLDEQLRRHVIGGRVTCSAKVPPQGTASIYIIAVGTPLSKDGDVSLQSLEEVLADVAAVIDDGDVVVLRSTVKIGTSRKIAKHMLDASGRDYDLAFCPERTLEGLALKEITSLPQIVGGLTPRAVERAADIFQKIASKVIRVDSLETAEMIKLVNNTERDVMFAFANEIAEMCDAWGVSATQVISSASEDYPRSRLTLPGPVGGPCLEKDAHILAESMRETGYMPRISLAGRRLNEELPRSSMVRISELLATIGLTDLGNSRIVILGLAFKGTPQTSDLRGTMAMHILEAARSRWPRALYAAFDPIVPHAEFAQFGVDVATTLEEAFESATLILIQNNHRTFSEMPIERLAARMTIPGLIYDYWNLFDSASVSLPLGRYYAGLGTSTSLAIGEIIAVEGAA